MLNHATLHHAIVRHIVDCGYVPIRAELAGHFTVDDHEMDAALRALAEYHGVVLHPHAAEVWVIHPFATSVTPFVVRKAERLW